MDRRAFLSASLLLLGGVHVFRNRTTLPESAFLSVLFDNFSQVKALGEAFRRSHPHLPAAHKSHAPLADLLHTHSAAIEDDFVNGRVLVVDGWLVSRTEALICAAV